MSDYKKNHIESLKYIPETIQSPVNRVLFAEIFDKFLTKREFKKVSGHIGTTPSSVPTIPELTPHRQAYQLQPHVTYTSNQTYTDYSFEDLMNLAERYGIDTTRFDEWGVVNHTNFVPPINLDKFLNFTNYYWLDETNRDSLPQYIVMANPRIIAVEQQLMVARHLLALGNPTIAAVTTGPSVISLTGQDYTSFFSIGDPITITGSTNNNGTYQVANISFTSGNTVIEIAQALIPSINDGQVVLPDITVQLRQQMRYVLQTSSNDSQPFDTYPYDVLPFDDIDPNSPYYVGLNDWQLQNKWVHKDDIPNTAYAKRATFPIIEYLPTLQMNEWSLTEYEWLYRSAPDVPWVRSNTPPTALEITHGQIENAPTNDYISIDFPNVRLYVAQTEIPVGFTAGSKFTINGSNEIWTVQSITVDAGDTSKRWVKVVEANLPFFSYSSDKRFCFINQDNLVKNTVISPSSQSIILFGDISSQFTTLPAVFTVFDIFDKTPSYYRATAVSLVGSSTEIVIDPTYRPIFSSVSGIVSNISETSKGDPWRSFTTQWLFDGIDNIIPVDKQIENPTTISVTHAVIPGSPQSIFTVASGQKYLSNNGDVRVSIDGRELYIGFEEGWYDGVTFVAHYEMNKDCNAVRLYDPVTPGSDAIEVTVATNVQALSDLGLNYVYVRTDADEENFVSASLVQYRKRKQLKTKQGQYPQFDIYDLNGVHTNETNSIIQYTEDPINGEYNKFLNKKIAKPTLKDYSYDILIVDDTERNFCYIDTDLETSENPKGLSTIWRSLPSLKTYTPRVVDANRRGNGDTYVDSNGNTVTVSGVSLSNGYWEIPYEYKYNIHHETKNLINFSEMIQHCDSIIKSQAYAAGEYFRGLLVKDYGVGGNIKEITHNYDRYTSNLMISIILDEVLRFGGTQQQALYSDVQQYFVQQLISVLVKQQTVVTNSVLSDVIANVITTFNIDDVNNVFFGDSLTYDATTSLGIKNLCHTLPFIGLAQKTAPYIIQDSVRGIYELSSHDGHLQNLTELLKAIPTNAHLVKEIPGAIISNTIPGAPVEGTVWFNGVDISRYHAGAWEQLDTTQMFLDTLLTIEESLYAAAPTVYKDLTPLITVSNESLYNDHMREQFTQYAGEKNVTNPYANPEYNVSNAFTWNYSSVDIADVNNPLMTPITSDDWAGGYKQIYLNLFGTSYPHLEPWKLQGYKARPVWWTMLYSGAPSRRWTTTMWNNIMSGTVPNGQLLPDGSTSTGTSGQVTQYDFVCVNITNSSTTDGYLPDALMPPFWVAPSSTSPNNIVQNQILIRNASYVDMTAITNGFEYGDGGYYEMLWKESSHYLFDDLVAKYKIEPLKFFRDAFSQDAVTVLNDITYDSETGQLLSHKHDVFFGSLKNDAVYRPISLTSLYVFYGRYNNLDLNHSDITGIWNNWEQHLAHGTNTIIDTQSVQLLNDRFDIIPDDYTVALKRVEGIVDTWFTNIVVDVEKIGRRLTDAAQLQNWDFMVSTSSPVPVYVDVYKSHYYKLATLTAGDTFTVVDNTMTLALGEAITFTSDLYLSEDLQNQKYFYVIPATATTFKIARTYTDALNNVAVTIADPGMGQHYMAAPASVYVAMEGQTNASEWLNVKVDRSVKTSVLLPQKITGLQNTLNFIDSYIQNLKDIGVQEYNFEYPDVDVSTGRRQDWQYEKELMIDTMYRYQLETYSKYGGQPAPFKFIMNPYKQNMWIKTANGRLSEMNNEQFNVVDRCFMYDVFGRTIPSNQMVIYRSDNAQITSISDMNIGGGHILIDGYEHVIVFQDDTTDNVLVFSSFLGVNAEDFVLFMDAQDTVNNNTIVAGGYFLNGNELIRNIEQTTNNMLEYYDPYADVDSAIKQQAMETIGFKSHPVFYKLGVTPEAEFVFWKGLIKQKGTINALNTLSNIQSLSDIEVDEFWAYKKNNIGSNKPNLYVDVKIQPENALTDIASFKFSLAGDPKPTNTPIDVILNPGSIDNWSLYPLQHECILDANIPNYLWKAVCEMSTGNGSDNTATETITGGAISHLFDLDKFYDSFYAKVYVDNATMFVNESVPADTIVGTTYDVTLPFMIIEDADMLTVYLNNTPTTNYTVAWTGSVYEVTFTDVDSTIDNTFGCATKNCGIIRMGSSLYWESYDQIRFTLSGLHVTGDATIELYGVKPTFAYNNHSVLIDTLSKTDIDEIRSWHPMYDDHTQSVMVDVDLYAENDPAVYDHELSVENTSNIGKRWTDNKTDLIWFKKDTYNSNYTNDVAYGTSANSLPRFSDWGAMRLGKQYGVYQWVETDVGPDQWHQIDILRREGKIAQETDNTLKYIGTPQFSVQKRTRTVSTDPWGSWIVVNDGIVNQYTLTDSASVDVSTIAAQGDYVLVFVNERLYTTAQVDGTLIVPVTDIPVISNFKQKITVINKATTRPATDVVEYRYAYNYSTKFKYVDGLLVERFYYWVTDSTTQIVSKNVNTRQMINDLTTNPASYAIVNNAVTLGSDEYAFNNIALASGVRAAVTERDRYVVRFNLNESLTNASMHEIVESGNMRSASHEMWYLIREFQNDPVPQELWQKLINSLLRYDMDTLERLPSVERELYDINNNEVTQYGFGSGCVVLDKQHIIDIIQSIILDPAIDITPHDKVSFINTYTFDTDANIILTMNTIYNSFNTSVTNNIFFTCAEDMLSVNNRVDDLFKTSFVSLTYNAELDGV